MVIAASGVFARSLPFCRLESTLRELTMMVAVEASAGRQRSRTGVPSPGSVISIIGIRTRSSATVCPEAVAVIGSSEHRRPARTRNRRRADLVMKGG